MIRPLCVDDFALETLCPANPTVPIALDNVTFFIPVPTIYVASCGTNVVHAEGKAAYRLTWFSFRGIFGGGAVAPDDFDELAIFAASDVQTYSGLEFGFRLSLKHNRLLGYIQNGEDTITQGKVYFHNAVIQAVCDNLEHDFLVAVHEVGHVKYFNWYIDGTWVGGQGYTYPSTYVGKKYHIVATVHRKEGGWDATGLGLTVGQVQVGD